jgi:hypothetical protein
MKAFSVFRVGLSVACHFNLIGVRKLFFGEEF